MTPEERTEKLEERVDRLESQYREDIVSIHLKLDVLTNRINDVLVKTTKNECPAPGSCVALSQKVEWITMSHDATMKRVERLELRLIDVEQWKGKAIGALGIIVIVANTLLAIYLKK